MQRRRMSQWVALAAFAGAATALSGVPAASANPLRAGSAAPDFTLPDQDGKLHKLRALRGSTVVLAFYPADMTPGCTLEARSFRDTQAEFAKRKVPVYGISVQDVKSHRTFCDQENLNYTLLADVGGKVAEAYGVRMPTGVARRVTFIVDGAGRVVQTIDNVEVARHGAQVIAALDALRPAAGSAAWTAKIGRPVPAFHLPDAATGQDTEVAPDPNVKATVIAFVCAGCPISAAYEDRLRGLAATYRPRGVRFVGISANANETSARVAAHFRSAPLGFPILRDEGARIADNLAAEVTPQVYVIDGAGVLRYSGRIDDSAETSGVKQHNLRDAIAAVLAGKAPRVSSARAFGCRIARPARR